MNSLSPEFVTLVRFGIFWGVLLVLIVIEQWRPWRRVKPDWSRLGGNVGLVLISSGVLKFFFPILAVGIAALAEQYQIGLFHYVNASQHWQWVWLIAIYLLLDMAIYIQHRLFHVVPMFWRTHRVHHTDEHLDATSALRFHPLEIVASMIFKFGVIFCLGAPVYLVIVFEVMLNGVAMFNHSNITINAKIERWFIVTPAMHRIHHSIEHAETNSNFGNQFSCWDRLFGTYLSHAAQNERMVLGTTGHQNRNLWQMLKEPLARDSHD